MHVVYCHIAVPQLDPVPRVFRVDSEDCKTSGFYFIFHLNYRRTRWRIIACPHNAEIEDPATAARSGV